MKKLIPILLFYFISSLSFGQIYVNSDSDESITIIPSGIIGKLPNSTKNDNVALGAGALRNITNQYENVAVGNNALYSLTGTRSTAFGSLALYSSTTPTFNQAFGNNTLEFTTTGSNNTAFGSFALRNNTVLGGNVAIGVKSLYEQSIYSNANGSNIAVGYFALYSNNTKGIYNTGIGAYALQNNVTGSSNLAIGYQAAIGNESGVSNVVVGNNAFTVATGLAENVVIGNGALYNNNQLGNHVAIGYNAGYTSTQNNMLHISNSNTVTPLLGGIGYMKKVAINRNLNLAGGNFFLTRTEALQVEGQAFKTSGNGNWIIPSDRRLKKNITPLNSEEILAKVLQMKGVTYEMKDSTQKGLQYGFIAQELREVFPDKINENADGYLSADYGSYTAIEIEAIKALHEKIAELEKYNTTLKERIEKLKSAKEVISKNIDRIESEK
ncbi:tail fiber domain-containing protein [Emticicia sp. C21]|uniref:tail fiber domain-containing protein n=1 Tax=Emticicia sp. C21 TaxID=2302915 RepID=UPI000E354FAC|nr:tail fiber domain-containing protein [Emticicia sp. C21]RFS16065.1 hypothetical protein D0T08_14340 [Emticicia sp. C21]